MIRRGVRDIVRKFQYWCLYSHNLPVVVVIIVVNRDPPLILLLVNRSLCCRRFSLLDLLFVGMSKRELFQLSTRRTDVSDRMRAKRVKRGLTWAWNSFSTSSITFALTIKCSASTAISPSKYISANLRSRYRHFILTVSHNELFVAGFCSLLVEVDE